MYKSKPMHISVLSSSLYEFDQGEFAGGKQRQMSMIFHRLASEGFRVSVLSNGESKSKEYFDGIEYNLSPHMDSPGMTNKLKKILLIRNYIDSHSPDICYIRGNYGYNPIVKSVNTDSKIVFGVSNDRIFESKNTLFKKHKSYLLSIADFIICQTDKQKQLLSRFTDTPSKVIPNCYPKYNNDNLLPFKDRKYFLWVGRLEPHKNPEVYLELAKENKEKKFILIGAEGSSSEYHKKIYDKSRKIGNLEFYSFVHPENIHEYFKKSFALINTSAEEGFPNVYLESWRAATPVLSFHHDVDNVLKDNKGGNLCKSKQNMNSEMEKIHNNIKYFNKLSSSSHKLFTHNYQLGEIYKKYIKLFNEISQNHQY